MKRSAGVTIAAIIVLIGSAFVVLSAALGAISMFFAFRSSELEGALRGQGKVPVLATMIAGSLINLALAGWGIATGIGLLRLKSWSRISALVFAGLLAVMATFVGLTFLFIPLPAIPDGDQSFYFVFRVMIGTTFAALFAIAVWWLVLFTRKSVVEQFSGAASLATARDSAVAVEPRAFVTAPQQPRRPLAVTIIAWFYLASLPSMIFSILIYQLQKMSVPFFGLLLEGKEVVIYFIINSSVLLLAGIALLKNRAWGFWLAFSVQLFGLLNIATILMLPGGAARWKNFTASLRPSFLPQVEGAEWFVSFPQAIYWIGLGTGFLFGIVILWILWTARKRYFEFIAIQTSRAPNTY